jgi:nucleoid-associated protein YgaU
VALLWAAANLIGGIPGGGEASTSTPAAAASRYVVAPGDTLWDVAMGLDVGGDVRDVVDRLAEFNGTDRLVPGQVIEIPSDLAA